MTPEKFLRARAAEDARSRNPARNSRALVIHLMLNAHTEAEFCERDAWSAALMLMTGLFAGHPDFLPRWLE